jgi:transposase-like protein
MMRRTFTREFKLDVCQKAESGESSKARLCREHALSPSMLDRWIEQYRARGEEAFSGAGWRAAVHTPDARVRELEAALGRAHLEIEFLQEALGKLSPRPGRKSP